MPARQYSAHETRPLHPVTGQPADWYWELEDEACTRLPRWKSKRKELAENGGVPPEDRWYSTSEVARVIGRHHRTVLRYCQEGLMVASRGPSVSGGRRGLSRWFIRGTDLLAFVNAHPNVVPVVTLL